MKKTTITKIIDNQAMHNRRTVIGRYTYKADLNTGEILRCKTEDIDRMWIDHEGNQFGPWEVVAYA